ncbi:MAG: hypothetical protein HY875_16725 [Chloroflexi bacterium]|nr:hypothetical protein [Chloroflexota bacterium]
MSSSVYETGAAAAGGAIAIEENFGCRLAEDSLLEAAAHLERVIAAAPPLDPWYDEVHAAIRDCTLAVESHLNAIYGPDGIREAIGRAEPRLLPRIEHLDTALTRLLLEFWEAKEPAVDRRSALLQSLNLLAARLRRAARGEFDIVWDWTTPVGGGD